MSAPLSIPDVTFVVAAYNSADTIMRAIESALSQEGVTVEVIVVDDCSTDATPALVAAIRDLRVRLIALDRNRGARRRTQRRYRGGTRQVDRGSRFGRYGPAGPAQAHDRASGFVRSTDRGR